MLVKVIGLEPVEVFFTVTVALPVVPVMTSLKFTLEGVMVMVGVDAAAGSASHSQHAIRTAAVTHSLANPCETMTLPMAR